MFLKAIEIYGFKSFGEKVSIEFSSGLTSIVGPNGSGKSNILDAVLWVLGEQSYKSIRAKEGMDVIFSGGKNKKPMKYAEVSLYIDNSQNFLDVEDDEVKITRKILNTGENEYLINDKKARLKDISNMFLDTGVGKNAYSVIGQGKVEKIIGSSPKEVKNIIEEAAGIKKYQAQKNESAKNLDRVDLELEKIELILQEVKENRDKIENQATNAKSFLELDNNKKILTKEISLVDRDKIQGILNESSNLKTYLERELNDYKKKFDEINTRLDEIENSKKELKKYIDENSGENNKLKREIDDKEREKIKISERINGYKREIEDREERLKNNITVRDNKSAYIEKLKIDLEELKNSVKSLEDETKQFEEKVKKLEKEKSDYDMESDVTKIKLRDLELEKIKLITDIENSNKRENLSSSNIAMLEQEKKEYQNKLDGLSKEEAIHKEEYNKKNKEYEDSLAREKFLEQELSKISQTLNHLGENLRNSEYNEKRVTNKLTALLRIEENNEGFFKGVKEVLNAKIDGVEGVFISLIDIPEMYQKAISMGIPGNMQDIVVDTSNTAKKAIELLKQRKVGRASFLALDTIKVYPRKNPKINLDGVIGYAKDLVKTNPKYQIVVDFLLSNLLVVDKMDTGLYILKNNLYSGNIVTLSGELLSARGRITGGDSKNTLASQIFERKKEINNLKIEQENMLNNIKKFSKDYDVLTQKLGEFEQELDRIDSVENSIKKELQHKREVLNQDDIKIQRVNKDIKTVTIELENELKYIDEFKKKLSSSTNEKEKIEFMIKSLKESEEKNSKKNRELQRLIEEEKNKFSDKKILYLNSKNNILIAKKNIEKEEIELNEIISQKDGLNSKLLETKKSLKESEERVVELNENLNIIIKKYEQENSVILEKVNLNQDLGEEERELIKKKQEVDSYILHKNDNLEKSVEKIDRLKKTLWDLNLKLRDLENIEVNIEGIDIESKRQELNKITNKLKNFENVNLFAIEEFKALDKRYNYLNGEKEDLEKGKSVLVNLISEIDETIHSRFLDAYKNINENFNKMCMETLNNSVGSLNLINPDDFDNSGVEIFVKFKNKKRQSLSLLSGGEKSMVAIAFIMAIFLYKPSPFTFLDEIEAALDEKNTMKLISKLKEFNDKSQFILITHNKNTMRESDSIFGVTMNKEIGISKIVPVSF